MVKVKVVRIRNPGGDGPLAVNEEHEAPSVEELRNAGFGVVVRHRRRWRSHMVPVIEIAVRHGARTGMFAEVHQPDNRGGSTEVTLLAPDGRYARGRSICTRDDQFCKRTGYVLAAERALEALEAV